MDEVERGHDGRGKGTEQCKAKKSESSKIDASIKDVKDYLKDTSEVSVEVMFEIDFAAPYESVGA